MSLDLAKMLGHPNGGASTRTSSQIFVVRCAVHIAVEKASKSGADVSILKTSRQLRLQMLLTSLTPRTDQYFAFLFGIASLQINI